MTLSRGHIFLISGVVVLFGLWMYFAGGGGESRSGIRAVQRIESATSTASISQQAVDSVSAEPLTGPLPRPTKPGPSKPPFALAPGPQNLGASVADALARSDVNLAHSLSKSLEQCLTLPKQQAGLEFLRERPTEPIVVQLIQERTAQIQRTTAECQTLSGDAAELHKKLVSLAFAGGVPGAAATAAALNWDAATSEVLARVAADARGSELRSLMIAIVGAKVPISEAERMEMVAALLQAYEKRATLVTDIVLTMGQVSTYFWQSKIADSSGKLRPREEVFERVAHYPLPPDLVFPTDPAALERIARLAQKLVAQDERTEQEKDAARRRAAGH